MKLLSLNLSNSVAAVTLENEALLSVVFGAVMARVITIYCEQFTLAFPNLGFDGDFFQATKRAFLQLPTEISGQQLSSEISRSASVHVLLEQELNNLPRIMRHFRAGW